MAICSKEKLMLNTITNITIGIRYARSFRILDVAGEVIDDILYSSDSPFGVKFFPKITEDVNRERILFNPETKNVLRINTDDLILRIKVQDFERDFKKIVDDFIPYFKDEVFQTFKIHKIRRFGVIYSHSLPITKDLNSIISEFSKQNVKEPNNTRLYFSQKLSVPEAQFRKGLNDYFNTIYTFTQIEDELLADLDFQRYFEPNVEDIRDSEPEQCLEDSKKFLTEKFHSWLKNYGEKTSKTK